MSSRKTFIVLAGASVALGIIPVYVWEKLAGTILVEEFAIFDWVLSLTFMLSVPGLLLSGGLHSAHPLWVIAAVNTVAYAFFLFAARAVLKHEKASTNPKRTLFPDASDETR
jgi:hypothetical protein